MNRFVNRLGVFLLAIIVFGSMGPSPKSGLVMLALALMFSVEFYYEARAALKLLSKIR